MAPQADRAEHWNSAYNDGDEKRSWTEAYPTRSVEAIRSVAPSLDAPIIDIGAGSSLLAAALLAEGHTDLTMLDLSEAALDLARDRMGADAERVNWVAADLFAWQPVREYAVWHDRAVLHFFTTPNDRVRYAGKLHTALRPGGHAIIATFAPDGPERCSGLPVWRSSAQGILDLLGGDFSSQHVSTANHTTPSGSVQPFTWVVARRLGSD